MAIREHRENRIAAALIACVIVAGLASCGGEDGGNAAPNSASSPTPSPSSTPTPTDSTVEYIATQAPFGLTANQTFDVFGWDAWPAAPVPSTMQLRWNAATSEYELFEASYSGWARLRKIANAQDLYDIFSAAGALFPYRIVLSAPSTLHAPGTGIGDARIFQDSKASAFVAFGSATPSAAIPTIGSVTCSFGMDEAGSGSFVINYATGSVIGEVEPFWGTGGNPPQAQQITNAFFRPDSTRILSASYGAATDNLVEARLFGPAGGEIAVRSKGEVTGIMTGSCSN